MKKILLSLLLIITIVCFISYKSNASIKKQVKEEEKAQVIVLAGGENMVGYSYSYHLYEQDPRTKVKKEKYEEFKNGYDNVKILYKNMTSTSSVNNHSDVFINAKIGLGKYADENYLEGCFGPELGLAELLSYYYPTKTTYIIKYSGSGHASLLDEYKPQTGLYYKGLVDLVNTGLEMLDAQNVKYEISALCFAQGEWDAYNQNTVYMQALSNFVSSFRSLYSDKASSKGIAFIDSGVSAFYTDYKVINNIKYQYSLLESDNYYIDTIKENLTYNLDSTDRKHWDSYSTLLLGKYFGQKILEAYKK
ncbi:MAG: hypothetical protein LBV51_05440 [Acholeplasmatales bacterium]|jgi:hypothetical protein|nr:hypothetical protein [Acholeplasmatales bacterium]